MNIKNRTKVLFADTLKEMMKYKELKDIHIGELCDACGMNRRTFYYHFQDKYDLMAWLWDHIYDDTSGTPENIFSLHTTEYVFSRIKEEQSFYKIVYYDSGISNLVDYLIQYNYSRFEEKIKSALNIDALDDEQKFSLRMYCYGGLYMSREWVLGGCKLSPKVIAEQMFCNMPDWMKECKKKFL